VTSVAMRFFRNAARSTSKKSFLRAYEHTSNNQLGVRGLERARPQRRLPGGDVRAKISFKKMTTKVPEIKLVKLLLIALTEKIHR